MDIQADEKLITRYLLGDMAEDERVEVEARFFADDDFYSRMLAIQEELVDDYVQGDLSPRERELFEASIMASPRRRERVLFASALGEALAGPPTEREEPREGAPSWWRAALAFVRAQGPAFNLAMSAAVFVLLLGAAWLAVENRRLDARLERAHEDLGEASKQAEADRAEFERRESERRREMAGLQSQSEGLRAKLREEQGRVEEIERKARAANRSRSASSNLVAFALTPGITRSSDEPERILVPARAGAVRLQLDLEREEVYRSYRVEIRTAGGDLVWSQIMLSARSSGYGQAVFLTVPSDVISPGEYEVALKGITAGGRLEDAAYYYFIALRR